MRCLLYVLAVILASSGLCAVAQEPAAWTLLVAPDLQRDVAVGFALDDLQTAARELGIDFTVVNDLGDNTGNVIIVAADVLAEANAVLGDLSDVPVPADPQSFTIRTIDSPQGKRLIVLGADDAGTAYGLYWLWDRIRVTKTIPDLDVTRTPALTIRCSGATDKRSLRDALRYSVNWIVGSDVNELVPWKTEPEASLNAANRDQLRPLLDAAHGLHMKYLVNVDELSYHPALLAEFNATLDPADPALWDMLQEKYRMLFAAMPELDGVCFRTGELTRVVTPYKAFDIMHDPEDSGWTLAQRYQTFLQKMHEVLVDELDKIYYHRTWVTNATEQHSVPEVYRAIFTEDIPTEGLYLSPYLTLADRWLYQPINPTFNLTPHKMLVLMAMMDYHAHTGVKVFPTYPGPYFEEGMKQIYLDVEHSNVVGTQTAVPRPGAWESIDVTAYAAYRLAWDPAEKADVIARDFAAIHFGADAADEVGEILMLSYDAYKDGLYIKPVAESIRGNTLPQLRLTTFPLQGIPQIDQGRAHIEWLRRTIYEPSLGKMDEAIERLDSGLAAAGKMYTMGQDAAKRIDDAELAQALTDSLELTRLLIATNNLYVKTCYAYFAYRDNPADATRQDLAKHLEELKATMARFRAAPGFVYKLYGVEQLVENADRAIADLDAAESALANAPAPEAVDGLIAAYQQQHRDALAVHGKAKRFYHWKGRVDGRDVLTIRGDTVEMEHLQSDPIQVLEESFDEPLPKRPVTVLLRDLQSLATHPFVLEQPSAENDYAAVIYLFDQPGGYGLWEFELYYLDESAEDAGLLPPWAGRGRETTFKQE